jgi:hypothetical protein
MLNFFLLSYVFAENIQTLTKNLKITKISGPPDPQKTQNLSSVTALLNGYSVYPFLTA